MLDLKKYFDDRENYNLVLLDGQKISFKNSTVDILEGNYVKISNAKDITFINLNCVKVLEFKNEHSLLESCN